MNSQAPEADEADPSLDPNTLTWVQEQRDKIKNKCPESLQKSLNEKLDTFVASQLSQSEINAQVNNLETLIKNAQTLNEAVTHYEERMTPLMPSVMLRDNIEQIWKDFKFEQLEKNALEKVMRDLADKVDQSEKETVIEKDFKEKLSNVSSIENFLEDSDQKPFALFFNNKERGKIYADIASLPNEKAVAVYKGKLLKRREKRESSVRAVLNGTVAHLEHHDWGKQQLSKLRKKYGDGIVALDEFKNVESEIEEAKNLDEAFVAANDNLESANDNYRAKFKKDHPGYRKAKEIKIEEEKAQEEEQQLAESYESKEMKIKVVQELKIEAENAAKYWGKKAQDRQHARRGVGTTLKLLEAGAMPGYTAEQYEAAIKHAGPETPYNKKYSVTHGQKRPEVFYDLPTNVEDFTAARASSAASLINTSRQNLSEQARACASLFYNNFHRDRDPNMVAPSIHEFISTCNSMVSQLKTGPKAANDNAAQTA